MTLVVIKAVRDWIGPGCG